MERVFSSAKPVSRLIQVSAPVLRQWTETMAHSAQSLNWEDAPMKSLHRVWLKALGLALLALLRTPLASAQGSLSGDGCTTVAYADAAASVQRVRTFCTSELNFF